MDSVILNVFSNLKDFMKSPGSKYLALTGLVVPQTCLHHFAVFLAPRGAGSEPAAPSSLPCCPQVCFVQSSDRGKLQPSSPGDLRAACLEPSVILAGNRTCSEQSPPKSVHTEHAPAAYLCSTVGSQAPVGGNSSAKAVQRNKERAEFPLASFQCCFSKL